MATSARMGYTLGEIAQQIVDRFNNQSIANMARRWANNGLMKLYRRVPAIWRVKEDYFTTTAGVVEYSLMPDYMEMHHVRNITKENELMYFDYKDWLTRYPLNSAASSRVTPADVSAYTVKGYRTNDYFSNGTATINDKTVVATFIDASVFPVDITERIFKIKNEDYAYRITSKDYDYQLTLRDSYMNPADTSSKILSAGAAYTIDDRQCRIMEVNLPAAAQDIYITYFSLIPKMVTDNDVPQIPPYLHDLLVIAGIASGAAYDEKSGVIIADARREFESGVYEAVSVSMNEMSGEAAWTWSSEMVNRVNPWPPNWGN